MEVERVEARARGRMALDCRMSMVVDFEAESMIVL